jgi:capsular polysaccharide biosynthesis protein
MVSQTASATITFPTSGTGQSVGLNPAQMLNIPYTIGFGLLIAAAVVFYRRHRRS